MVVPQLRQRFVLLAGLRKQISFPKATHSRKGENGKFPWRTIKSVLNGSPDPDTFFHGNGKLHNWHVVRDISQINKERLKHVKPGGSRF